MTTAQRVLVVEDDALVATTVMRVLARAKYEGRWARTAKDAREQAAAWDPDVVLIDRHLPDGDGIALAAALRQGPTPPRLVLMSGDPVDEAAAAHVDASLLKPASIQALLASLKG
jgi:DNA-binding response OmpR family regulator